jgi:hypothetical protein
MSNEWRPGWPKPRRPPVLDDGFYQAVEKQASVFVLKMPRRMSFVNKRLASSTGDQSPSLIPTFSLREKGQDGGPIRLSSLIYWALFLTR